MWSLLLLVRNPTCCLLFLPLLLGNEQRQLWSTPNHHGEPLGLLRCSHTFGRPPGVFLTDTDPNTHRADCQRPGLGCRPLATTNLGRFVGGELCVQKKLCKHCYDLHNFNNLKETCSP